MSVRSAKTAVTWAKPLREKERVSSRPGMPASTVSIGKVTCFSTSIGVSAGAMALTWTCTLVTSGTASIGRRSADQTPTTAAARVTRTTSQRRRTEKARMWPNTSVLDRALEQLGLEQEGVAARHRLGRLQPAGDLGHLPVGAADRDQPLLETFGRAHEHHALAADRLQRRHRHGNWHLTGVGCDGRGHEGAGPPRAVAIVD